MAWSKLAIEPTLGGHALWELEEAWPVAGTGLWLPVYVQLLWDRTDPASMKSVVLAVCDPAAAHLLADHDRDALATELQRPQAVGQDVRTMVFCQPDAIESPLWTVLHVGAPVAMDRLATAGTGVSYQPRTGGLAPLPLVAVIDDGIGFLNYRFRSGARTTRFEAVFLQTTTAVPAASGDGLGQETYMGRVVERRDIQAMMDFGPRPDRCEAEVMRAMNERLFGPAGHRSTDRHSAHGTAVLDIAAGADFGEPMAAVPLLGVQVPPLAVGQTSGRRLDNFVLAGIRWLIHRALRAIQADGIGQPLLINLSLAALAGPKDGSGFLEQAVVYEIERFRRLSDDCPIRLVLAYGNSRLSRLVARADVLPGASQPMCWRILPDDATASYLEIRVPKGAAVGLRVDPPGAAAGPNLPLSSLSAGWELGASGGKAAMLYRASEANSDLYVLAVGPTMRDTSGPTAPAGAWRISVKNEGKKAISVSLKVRRDDTPEGYRRRGRQSWLDHPDAWHWEAESGGWMAPGQKCPVSRAGTAMTLAGIVHPAVYQVAAAARGLREPAAARYSSEGEAAGTEVPTLAAFVDMSRMLPGRRATGVVTGSRARLSGTSAAAPLVLRALINQSLSPGGLASPPFGSPHDPAEMAALLGAMPIGSDPRRLGKGILQEAEA